MTWISFWLYYAYIQPFPYNMLRIRIFHTVDPFEIWNDQLGHPKECVKN